MILIVTHKEDFTVDFVVDKLNQRGVSYHRLNCEDLDKDFFQIRINKGVKFTIRDCNQFKSVWFRRVKLPFVNESYSDSERDFLLAEYYSLLQNFLLTLDVKWLSHPVAVYTAENKLFQLKLASEIGFDTPDTLLTNSREKLSEFYFSNNRNVIIKPLNRNKIVNGENQKLIFTNKLKDTHIGNLNAYELTPSIYQELIQKDYEVRVTVVGKIVFAARVDSQTTEETTIDWRRGRLPFHKYDLPIDVSDKCIALVRKLNLSFGAIDLVKSKTGAYFFLEINPNGQWVWVETDTGLQISNAIIDFLL